MRPFEIVQPADLAAACTEAAGADTTIKAAGIDLIDRLKERIESPAHLVDLGQLRDELGIIRREADGSVSIGALCTLAQVATAAELAGTACAGVREAAAEAASPQVRARATVGGNLLQMTRCWYRRSAAFDCAHGGHPEAGCLAMTGENRYHSVLGYLDCVRVHPSSLAPPLIALDAEVTVQSGDGTRRLPVRGLYPSMPMAARPEHTLRQGEVLAWVHLPAAAEGVASAYGESREKQAFDWATTAAAVRLALAEGKVREASICLGAVAPVPWPVPEAAAELVGKAPSRELFAAVAKRAYAAAQPLTHNTYKIEVGTAVLVSTLARAAGMEA